MHCKVSKEKGRALRHKEDTKKDKKKKRAQEELFWSQEEYLDSRK